MATDTQKPQPNSKPKRPALVVRREEKRRGISILMLIPALLLSALVHVGLVAVMFLFGAPSQAGPPPTELAAGKKIIEAEPPPPPERSDPFVTEDIDPVGMEFEQDINFDNDRITDVSVPGINNPLEDVGILNAPKDAPPVNLPPPAGFGSKGQGGAIAGDFSGGGVDIGMAGGYGNVGALALPGGFAGRSGGTREKVLREGGGTGESEAAVTRGLKWLARTQHPEGKWQLDGPFSDRGRSNDIAGTAFGLLPLLGAGKTHKAGPDNPYDKPIEKALIFLIRKQDRRTGYYGGGMYAHGIATIAMCEAYGLTQDPNLRRSAQMAVNYIVKAQHKGGGGWRYSPGQPGDTSVVGWQVMALKSAQMSGLEVPTYTMSSAVRFLDSACNSSSQGYGYTGPNPTHTMTAVGLLCRQYLQSWGPSNIRMIEGIDNHIKKMPPGRTRNMYYYYYATQVMHHFGGQAWKQWNDAMREQLIKTQVKDNGADHGSWSSAGDAHGSAGGRLMQTSLSLLTLEVYYRHLPLFQREAVYAMENK